jgi:tRNA(fMet)-specific endonuclease VapC
VAIAAITLAELLVGVELADARRRAPRRRFVADVSFTLRVIDYDAAVAASHAKLLAATRRQGRPRGAHDLIIAATAQASDRVVVSADPSAFAGLPGVDVRPHRR